MSLAPITVRYDVVNPESIVNANTKIIKSLDATRTSFGLITTSVRQMESGFRADALGAFTTSVTNADTKVSSFRTKLSQIGTTFAQNATSFGVATASIWGVYNAYDSLEKVQIRAHAAAQRVATLETTVATLTERRRQAVLKGNASAEQMAIIDDRITNAHNKLAVAQERNADLQQDVNEAWAGFASQVGPQAVAAGASIVQLATNLKGQMGGVVPAIKGFFAAFTGGGPVIGTVANEALKSSPIFQNMSNAMNQARFSSIQLSGAMKGLLLGGGIALGIIAVGEAINFFREQEVKSVTEGAAMQKSLASADASMELFQKSTTQTSQTLGLVVKGFGSDFQKLTDAANKFIDATTVAMKLKDADAQRQTILDLQQRWKALSDEYVKVTKNASFYDIISGHLAATQKELEGKIDEVKNKMNQAGANQTKLKQEATSLAAALLLQNGAWDANERFVLQSIANGDTLQQALVKFNILTDGGTHNIDERSKAMKTDADITTEATNSVQDWGEKLIESTKAGNDENAQLQTLAEGLGLVSVGSHHTTEELKHLIETAVRAAQPLTQVAVAAENLQIKLKAKAAAFEESFKATNDEIDSQQKVNDTYQDSIAVTKEIVTQTFGAAEAAQKAGESNADYKTRLDQLSGIAVSRIDEEKAYTLGLIKTASAMGLNVTRQADLSAAMHEGDAAIQDLILDNQTLVDIMNDSNRTREMTNKGLVQGREASVAFLDQINQQIASEQQQKADLELIAHHFGTVLPNSIDLTIEDYRKLIIEQKKLGSNAAATEEIMNREFSASRGALQELIDAATKGGKDWKEKWKDIKDIIPKQLRKDTKEAITDQAEMSKTIDEVIDKIGAYRLAWDNYNNVQKQIAINDLTDDLGKLENQLDDIATSADVDAIIHPLLQLKQNGLTSDELDTWQQFFELYNKLKSEGGGISDKDVEILKNWVAQHTGMKDMADNTKDATTAFEDLDPAIQKIVLNDILDRTIAQVTIDTNLQARAIRGLTTDYNQLALIQAKSQVAAKIDITGAVKSITRLIGDFMGYVKVVETQNPAARINITGAVKSITRLIDDFWGYVLVVNKNEPMIRINNTQAISKIKAVETEMAKVKDKDVTITCHQAGNCSCGKAEGGMLSAAQGRILTTSGPQTYTIGDNPGGTESIWAIPHDNPAPTVRDINNTYGMPPPVITENSSRVRIGPAPNRTESIGRSIVNYLHVEIPVYIGYDMIHKVVKDMMLENTGMFSQ